MAPQPGSSGERRGSPLEKGEEGPLKKARRKTILALLLVLLGVVLFMASNMTVILEEGLALAKGERILLHTVLRILGGMAGFLKEYSSLLLGGYGMFIAAAIFFEERNPDRTIAWLLVLLLVPVLGFVLYLFFGPDIRRRKAFRKLKRSRTAFRTGESGVSHAVEPPCGEGRDMTRKTVSLLSRNAGALPSFGNSVTMLLNGEETFAAIKKSLLEAKHFIHLEYYIIENGSIGGEIRDILVSKASSGVAVRVIYDSVGSWRLGKKFVRDLEKGGVQVHSFLPVSFPMVRRDLNYRNHRKIIVVDGAVGFMGGLNIGDRYITGDPEMGFWRDTHIRIQGEGAARLNDIFVSDWEFCTKAPFPAQTSAPLPSGGNTSLQIVASGPDSNWRSILHGYFSLIANARKSVWICTPYLVPGESLATALVVAAMSGVDVRLMIPHRTDHALVYWASLSNVESLLRAGVKVYSYEKGFLHSKILIADECIVSVGTANMDARSLEINFEVQSFVYDPAVARDFLRAFTEDLDSCSQFRLRDWLKRPLWRKTLEAAGRLWSSQL